MIKSFIQPAPVHTSLHFSCDYYCDSGEEHSLPSSASTNLVPFSQTICSFSKRLYGKVGCKFINPDIVPWTSHPSPSYPPPPQGPYDVFRGQNRYVTLPLLTWSLFEFNKFPDNKYYNNSHALYDQWSDLWQGCSNKSDTVTT